MHCEMKLESGPEKDPIPRVLVSETDCETVTMTLSVIVNVSTSVILNESTNVNVNVATKMIVDDCVASCDTGKVRRHSQPHVLVCVRESPDHFPDHPDHVRGRVPDCLCLDHVLWNASILDLPVSFDACKIRQLLSISRILINKNTISKLLLILVRSAIYNTNL